MQLQREKRQCHAYQTGGNTVVFAHPLGEISKAVQIEEDQYTEGKKRAGGAFDKIPPLYTFYYIRIVPFVPTDKRHGRKRR